MIFSELQSRFANLTLDTRTEWIAGGTQSKQALNDGYKEVFRKFINTYTGSVLMKIDKYGPLTITDGEATMPNDFYQLAKNEDNEGVFIKVLNGYYALKEIPFKVIFGTTNYKIIFNVSPTQEVYIDYVKKIVDLSANGDIPAIPETLHNSIVDFALVEYFRQQRDWNNVTASLQYAEGKVMERMNEIWQD